MPCHDKYHCKKGGVVLFKKKYLKEEKLHGVPLGVAVLFFMIFSLCMHKEGLTSAVNFPEPSKAKGANGVPSTIEDALVLTMNHQFPKDTAGSKIDQWFADEIHSATKGAVKIKIFWSNGLGTPQDNLSLLRRGRIDMAAMSAGYFPKELPLLSAPNAIPMAMESVCQSSELMKSFLSNIPDLMEEAKAHGVRPLFFHLLNPYLLVSKTPIKNLSDLKGKRIRTWGDQLPDLFRAAGAKPVPLFLPDLYSAMAQGVIDGCPFSVDLVISYKLHELARHITNVVIWEGPSWGVWISSSAWDKLSSKHQQIFAETAERARQKELLPTLEAERDAKAFLMYQGVKFHDFPPEDRAEWQTRSPDFLDRFIQNSTEKGKERAARKMVDLWKKTVDLVQSCP